MNGASQVRTREPKVGPIKFWGALVGVGLIVALAVACNGGGGESSPTAQPTAEGSPAPQPTEQAATGAACEALASLDKYRYVANVTLASPEEPLPVEDRPTPAPTLVHDFVGEFYFEYNIDASVIAPDRVQAEMRLQGKDDESKSDDDADTIADADDNCPFASNPGQEDADGDGAGDACEGVNAIIIGDRRWVTVGQRWEEVGAGYIVPYTPLDICNAIFAEVNLSQAKGEEESVNDVAARHYTFSDTPSGQAMASIFGPGSDMDVLIRTMDVDVWLAKEDGWPARIDLQGSGVYGDGRELRTHVSVDLRDINDENIQVEPPA